MINSDRARVIGRVADHLAAQRLGHPVRVAVDGITAAGKTTLAAELTAAIRTRGRPAVHLSMDGFHHRRAHRHRQGRNSAIGYYQDAYDFDTFAHTVLTPLGPGGDRTYRAGILDLATDEPIDEPPIRATPDTVLLVDGSFLQRLAGLWDETLFLDTSFPIARHRGTHRDATLLGGLANAETAYANRYHAACRHYLDEHDPATNATIVVANDDLDHPLLHRIGGTKNDTVALFSYGTLQLPQVQLDRFGRRLTGTPDALPGHRTDWITITDPAVITTSGTDRHPIVRNTGNPADTTPGTLLHLTTTELAAADTYEVDAYRRTRTHLASGTPAWSYLSSTSTP
ncbi:MAG TPA: hypothetical protein VFV67_33610 [Actinophytocola sp.]|uniref:hypothetical protein n=1 Tax=Actinophytocola sp. TaxID=1872138 RepID=UPI002DB58207|nr:hypothetical protein [Actinophytocola sp.]HEU5475606.1 hypothetical protein [Actinophytocola sp.]